MRAPHRLPGPLWAAPLLLAIALIAPVAPGTTAEVNLARAPGAVPFGSGSSGPFVIPRINDGRLDVPMGMWCSPGNAGDFIGVRLGDAPVEFDTVRLHLFGLRSAFTGWRLEGADDCVIDEDSAVATVYDPELLAADPQGTYANGASAAEHLVTISFAPASWRAVRLVLPNASHPVGIVEMEVLDRGAAAVPAVAVTGDPDVGVDGPHSTITLAAPLPVAEVLRHLIAPAGALLTAFAGDGTPLGAAAPVTGDCRVLARLPGAAAATGGVACAWFTVIDRSTPPPAPAVRTHFQHPPPPPKPPVTPPSAPAAPVTVRNLILGRPFSSSIYPEKADGLTRTGSGDWFAGQHFPQWLAVDLGQDTAFDYVSLNGVQVVHACIQSSPDGATWTNLVEIDHQRRPWLWNGCITRTRARYLRLVVLPPSWDVHVKGLVVADLGQPLMGPDGQPVPALAPCGEVSGLAALPPAAEAASR